MHRLYFNIGHVVVLGKPTIFSAGTWCKKVENTDLDTTNEGITCRFTEGQVVLGLMGNRLN